MDAKKASIEQDENPAPNALRPSASNPTPEEWAQHFTSQDEAWHKDYDKRLLVKVDRRLMPTLVMSTRKNFETCSMFMANYENSVSTQFPRSIQSRPSSARHPGSGLGHVRDRFQPGNLHLLRRLFADAATIKPASHPSAPVFLSRIIMLSLGCCIDL